MAHFIEITKVTSVLIKALCQRCLHPWCAKSCEDW